MNLFPKHITDNTHLASTSTILRITDMIFFVCDENHDHLILIHNKQRI